MTTAHRVALVTGAARRIGAAIARHLHAHGYALALHCRHSHAELRALCDELDAIRPGHTLIVQADLADVEGLPGLVAAAVERFGRLDALINNASSFYPTPLDEATPAQWEELFASNARAPFFLAKAAAPHLKASGGAVVNLADIYAQTPLRGYSMYSMSKAALVMATRALALELAPEVRVNAIAPGAIRTPLNENVTEGDGAERLLRLIPWGRIGEPEDVARAALFLVSDMADYIVGSTLFIDGGMTLYPGFEDNG